jgi:hypothetical protein
MADGRLAALVLVAVAVMWLQSLLLVVVQLTCSSSSSSKAKPGMVSSGCLLKARSLLHRLGHACSWLCHSSRRLVVWQLLLRCSMGRRRLRITQQRQQQQQQVMEKAARAQQGTLPSGSASSNQHVIMMPEKTVQKYLVSALVARWAAAPFVLKSWQVAMLTLVLVQYLGIMVA